MIPDIEKTVTGYLKTELGVKVAGEMSADTKQEQVKVTQIMAPAVGGVDADHFINFHVQLDCYASDNGATGQGEAVTLARNTREAMRAMPESTFSGVVVTAVRFGGMSRIPDADFTPPRQRYILDCFIYAHAVSA